MYTMLAVIRVLARAVAVSLVCACGSAKPIATPPTPTPTPTTATDTGSAAEAGSGSATADSDPTLIAAGADLYMRKMCRQCHSVDGTAGIGPSLKGYFGSTQTLEDGTEVQPDEARFFKSFDSPAPLKGFQPSMPVYGDQLSDTDRKALLAFVKSLK